MKNQIQKRENFLRLDDEHLNQKALSNNSKTMLKNSREYSKITHILKRRQTNKKVLGYNSLPGLQALSSPLQYFLSVFIALHKAAKGENTVIFIETCKIENNEVTKITHLAYFCETVALRIGPENSSITFLEFLSDFICFYIIKNEIISIGHAVHSFFFLKNLDFYIYSLKPEPRKNQRDWH
jgi:hypothetical protein